MLPLVTNKSSGRNGMKDKATLWCVRVLWARPRGWLTRGCESILLYRVFISHYMLYHLALSIFSHALFIFVVELNDWKYEIVLRSFTSPLQRHSDTSLQRPRHVQYKDISSWTSTYTLHTLRTLHTHFYTYITKIPVYRLHSGGIRSGKEREN